MLPYTDLLFEPGTKYSYSNPGIVFLGRIIERLSGDDYEVYIAKNIFMPLGMTRSFFDRAPYHLLAHRSHSYDAHRRGRPASSRSISTRGITVSNGGLNAPLGDMARYLAFLIGECRRAGGPRRVLKRASLDEMFTPQIARDATAKAAAATTSRPGSSCFIERHRGVELVGHSGDQNGFISHLYVHRPSRSGYVVAFNTNARSTSDPRAPPRGGRRLRDAIDSRGAVARRER